MRASSFFIVVGMISFFWFIGLPVLSWVIGLFALVNVIETDLDQQANRR